LSVTAVDDLSSTSATAIVVLWGRRERARPRPAPGGGSKADHGEVWIGGRNAAGLAAARDVTFVFQQFRSTCIVRVRQLAFRRARRPALPEHEIGKRIRVAELLRIPHKLGNKSTQLSAAKCSAWPSGRPWCASRLSISWTNRCLARCQARECGSNSRIQQELGATILYVTHDQIEAMTMPTASASSRGRLMQVGSPRQVYEDPQSVYVAQRLGQPQINLLPADLLPNGKLPAGAATLGIRTEHIVIAKAKSGQGAVERVEHLGDQNHLHVKVNGHQIVTLVPPDSALAAGDRVSLKPLKPLYFDRPGNRIRG
jgi:multiple sugar transport system ATP-binding protein